MKVCKTDLSMTRGDSETIIVKCFLSGEPQPLETGDEVTLTVRASAQTPIVIQKTVTVFDEHGWAVIAIDPEDTAELDFGVYVYDVQLTAADGTVTTLVPISSFTLTEEVTY